MLAIWEYFWDWPTEWQAPAIGTIVVCGSEADILQPAGALLASFAAKGADAGLTPRAAPAETVFAQARIIGSFIANAQAVGTLQPQASAAVLHSVGSVAAALMAAAAPTDLESSTATGAATAPVPANQAGALVSAGQLESVELC